MTTLTLNQVCEILLIKTWANVNDLNILTLSIEDYYLLKIELEVGVYRFIHLKVVDNKVNVLHEMDVVD